MWPKDAMYSNLSRDMLNHDLRSLSPVSIRQARNYLCSSRGPSLHMSKWPLHKFSIYTLMTCDVQSACGNKYKCVTLHVHLHAHSHLHARLHAHSHAHSQKLSQLMLCLIVINWVMYGYVSFPSNSHRHENWSWDCYLVDRVQKVGEENDIWK